MSLFGIAAVFRLVFNNPISGALQIVEREGSAELKLPK
jgi:hypothetical protein